MNQALAEWEAAHGYDKSTLHYTDNSGKTLTLDVDSVMYILAQAGYNTYNWACLTSGYQVYWYEQKNQMILYNSTLARIEYPDDYVGSDLMVNAENGFHIYNENHVKAQQFDMSLSSAVASGNAKAKADLTSVYSTTDTSKGIKSNEAANLLNMKNAIASNTAINDALMSSAGVTGSNTLVYYATREIVSANTANAYASLQIAAVGSSENPVELTNVGDIKENLYYLTVVVENGASEADIVNAKLAAGEYVYNIFDQITENKIGDDVTIIIAPGTEIDCSRCEWAPCKTFSGYFGTTDASKPVIINGAYLTPATGHSQTVAFNGSSSKYFVTGFFGTLNGETTVENVVFKNIRIYNAASDYDLTQNDIKNKLTNSRNTVGIIGGITDGWDGTGYNPGNVTLRNIKVEGSCAITGVGCVGGLVGYIGSANSDGDGKAKDSDGNLVKINVTIDNCVVSDSIETTDTIGSTGGYGTIGGIIGFCCRANSFAVTVKDCTFNGRIDGYSGVSGLCGDNQNCTVTFEGVNDVSSATFNEKGNAENIAAISTATASTTFINNGTIKYKAGIAPMYKAEKLTVKGILTEVS